MPLADPLAGDAEVVGGKAAALHRAAAAGLPTLPGVVVAVGAPVSGLTPTSPLIAEIRRHLGDGPLIARSSSPAEDTAEHSMAGRFLSVGSLPDDAALAAAVESVARSGEQVAEQDGIAVAPPVAVLVQPMVDGVGGVCFGIEPVSGRSDRLVAVCSEEGPDAVVSGRVEGMRHLLDRDGRILRVDGSEEGGRLSRAVCAELAAMVLRAGELFGSPQDVEFLLATDGTLHLLQSRPVTTEVRGAPVGPVYGSGPVAETFPDPLHPLEETLWVEPLREGLRDALRLAAMASHRELAERPLIVSVAGRVAIDLELTAGERPGRRWGWLWFKDYSRRAWGTWRVGRLRGALAAIARDVVQDTDGLLGDVGLLEPLSERQLVGLLDRSRDLLRSLHAHEILMGFLVSGEGARLTGVSVAMRSLIAGRRDGLSDDEIIARTPVVLALTGPRLDGVTLPRHLDALAPPLPPEAVDDEAAVLREALRLRVRWVQELTVRAAHRLGERLVAAGRIDDVEAIAALHFDELAEVVAGTAVPAPSRFLRDRNRSIDEAPALPARFRLDAEGRPVPVDAASGDGTGAGGGKAQGRVVHDPADAEPGTVLVVRHLVPELSAVVPRLSGLVAESGSPLAHLAILAREAGVATVVGSPGATARLDEGAVVEVDGTTGAVTILREGGERS
ncbi:MAG TPA: PEP/pyruvate-binding domain-containing protein [Acidimicrobiales bacterium]